MSSLVWKLMIWFLLLSLLPIGVIVIFVRQDVSDELTNLAKEDAGSQVSLLANEISSSIDDRQVHELIADATNEIQVAFLVGEDGAYVAHGDEARVGSPMLDDFSAEAVRQVLDGTDGVVVEEGTGRLVGFSTVPPDFTKVVLALDGSVVSAPMLRIERSALTKLVVSLLAINVAIGFAIWVVFRPIQRLTRAADEVGAGNLDVHIDPEDMEGELEVLTRAFNEMTRRLRVAHDELEQIVADRTAELRESEERLRTVVTSAPVILFAIDRDGVFTLSEGLGLEAMGLEPGQVVGQSAYQIYDEVPQILEDLRRALAGERFTSIVDVAGLTFESHYSPVRDESGQVVGLIGVSTDITERKQAEQTMREVAVLEERNRMAREIHDTMAQGFTGIVLQLEAGEQALGETAGEVLGHLGRAKALARECLQAARRSVWNLLPRALEKQPITQALEEEIRQFASDKREKGIFDLSGDPRELTADVQTALLRICQQALTNVRNHAQATEVTVSLSFSPDAVRLQIADDGVGFDPEAIRDDGSPGGFGLTGMEQRARLLGGDFKVISEKAKGTQVEVEIPTA